MIDSLLEKLRRNKHINEFLSVQTFAQLRKYIITGLLAFGLEYGSFRLINEIIFVQFTPWGYSLAKRLLESTAGYQLTEFTFSYLLANMIAYMIGFWVSFTLNRIWSFQSKTDIGRQLLLYSMLFVFNLGVTSFLMYVLSDIIGIVPHISKIIVMFAIVSWNFIIFKKIIYK